MLVLNNTNGSVSGEVVHQNLVFDDDEDFLQRSMWKSLTPLLTAMYKVNMALAILLGLVGVLLMATILDRSLRSKSQMWYIYHLLALSLYTSFIIHTSFHSGLSWDSKAMCYFAYYSTEYVFFGIAYTVLLINIEVYFTVFLPIERWQTQPFFRFIVAILSTWIFVCLLVGHLVINNNDSVHDKYCFYIRDKGNRMNRILFRETIPGSICFLMAVVCIVTFCLKQSRMRVLASGSGGNLKEMSSSAPVSESDWLRFTIFLNLMFSLRSAITVAFMVMPYVRSRTYIISRAFMSTVHVESMYMLPLAMFFLSDVRAATKAVILKAFHVISFGRLSFSGDLENLAVSFGNVNHESSEQ